MFTRHDRRTDTTPKPKLRNAGVCPVAEILGKTFSTQNFIEIGESAAELWPKNDFQHGGCPTS